MYIYICEIYILSSLYSVHYIHLYHVYSIDPLFRCRFVANSLAMDFDSMDESLAKTLQSFVEVISQKDGKSEEDRFFGFSRSGFESLVRFDCMQPLIFVMMCFRFDIQETISCILMCSCLCSAFILLHSGSRIERKGRSWRWVKPGFLGDGKNDGSSDLCPLALNQSSPLTVMEKNRTITFRYDLNGGSESGFLMFFEQCCFRKLISLKFYSRLSTNKCLTS